MLLSVSDEQGYIRHVLADVLRDRSGLELALLFGSAANGRLHPGSDVDIGILPADSAMSLSEELALQAELEEAVGRSADLVRLDHADPLLRWRAARDGICLYARSAVAEARFRAEAAIAHDELAPLIDDAAHRYRRRVLATGTTTPEPEGS